MLNFIYQIQYIYLLIKKGFYMKIYKKKLKK